MGSDDHGLRGVFDGEIGVLKAAHRVMNVVPFLLLRGDEQKHQVGAHGKIGRLIGDDERIEIGVQALQAGVHHGSDVVADGIHLGVKFAAQNAVTKINQAGTGIACDFIRTLLDDSGWFR